MDSKNGINETNMKRYTKDAEIKSANQIIIFKDDMQIINPTKEMILADGWEEYVEPEPTEYEKLVMARRDKGFEIERYDTSDDVNEFFINGKPLWLNREERGTLERRFRVEQKNGLITTTLWKNGIAYPMIIEDAIIMLDALEMYAIQCHDNTQRHLAAIQALQTIEEIEGYDHTTFYPQKLRF